MVAKLDWLTYSKPQPKVMLLECCYSVVTVVLQWSYSGLTVVLQWCRSGATVVSQ
jgi:hypothetical protein